MTDFPHAPFEEDAKARKRWELTSKLLKAANVPPKLRPARGRVAKAQAAFTAAEMRRREAEQEQLRCANELTRAIREFHAGVLALQGEST